MRSISADPTAHHDTLAMDTSSRNSASRRIRDRRFESSRPAGIPRRSRPPAAATPGAAGERSPARFVDACNEGPPALQQISLHHEVRDASLTGHRNVEQGKRIGAGQGVHAAILARTPILFNTRWTSGGNSPSGILRATATSTALRPDRAHETVRYRASASRDLSRASAPRSRSAGRSARHKARFHACACPRTRRSPFRLASNATRSSHAGNGPDNAEEATRETAGSPRAAGAGERNRPLLLPLHALSRECVPVRDHSAQVTPDHPRRPGASPPRRDPRWPSASEQASTLAAPWPWPGGGPSW